MARFYKIDILLALLRLTTVASAQKQVSIDSLQIGLPKAKADKQKDSILYELGSAFHRKKNYDQTIDYDTEAVKINTYMAVFGMPESSDDHAQRTIRTALEIRNFIYERKKQDGDFEIGIGINSGQVVAGIVGVKKFAHDLWGDAVNVSEAILADS